MNKIDKEQLNSNKVNATWDSFSVDIFSEGSMSIYNEHGPQQFSVRRVTSYKNGSLTIGD
jgi:hypothetical protein